MLAQDAAYELLKEAGRPLSSRELASLALERGLVSSFAQDPRVSIAYTIEKAIRDGPNKHGLSFVQTDAGRKITLPGLPATPVVPQTSSHERPSSPLLLQLPSKYRERLDLLIRAGLAETKEDAAVFLIERGWGAAAPEVKAGLTKQIDALRRWADLL